jgi:hypothetical protein
LDLGLTPAQTSLGGVLKNDIIAFVDGNVCDAGTHKTSTEDSNILDWMLVSTKSVLFALGLAVEETHQTLGFWSDGQLAKAFCLCFVTSYGSLLNTCADALEDLMKAKFVNSFKKLSAR